MSQRGKPDDLYVRARRTLLDAVEALGDHLDAVVLVGAQAVYMHAGDADLAVAEYTTDADFAIGPQGLDDDPLISDLMRSAHFSPTNQPGEWKSYDNIRVDLMVPEALAGRGTRSADLGPHGRRAARRARGLEGALVDRERKVIQALDPADTRSAEMNVAGPGALLVAKAHKISERSDAPNRLSDKDALDVLRLLRCVSSGDLRARLTRLQRTELSRVVTGQAIGYLDELFGAADNVGTRMAVRAAGGLEDPDVITSSVVVLTNDLLESL